jgi:antitoxin component of RelBE/YafQ-DinJ toxin-antitoxin module
MTKKVKSDWIGGRVDSDLKELVEEYIDNADITVGQLIRRAVAEYIAKHPIKEE